MQELTFANRLKALIDDVARGNVAEFVRRCKTVSEESAPSDTMVRKYLAGGSPTLERFVVIAKAGGVSLDWLAGIEHETSSVDTSNQSLPHGVRANVYVGDKCILSGILAPTETPLEITARVQVGETERAEALE